MIVVDQMLTGFDSKWINTLYIDKVLRNENIIQAFSRTNRLFGHEKPFGIIKYYRKPHTMKRNIESAVRQYSGEREYALFVDILPDNLRKMNLCFTIISDLFISADIPDFERLPDDVSDCKKFAKLFKELSYYLEASRIQGFKWEVKYEEELLFDEQTYLILALRYKELFGSSGGGGSIGDVPYDIEGHLIEINTGRIDAEYMNSKFQKYLKYLNSSVTSEEDNQKALNELHKTFATLTKEEQKYANFIIHDIQRGDVSIDANTTLRDLITKNMIDEKQKQIDLISETFGLNKKLLKEMINLDLTEVTLNSFGRFDKLISTVDTEKAKTFFERIKSEKLSKFLVNRDVALFLQEFILYDKIDSKIFN